MATSSVPVPVPLSLYTGNVAENWKKFKQSWQLYVIAAGFEPKPKKQKTAVLLSVIGSEALEVYQTFQWEEDNDQWDIDKVLEKFEKHCIPRKNILYETFKFISRRQEEGELIDSYVVALRRLAESCDFPNKERSIRDQLVFGLFDVKIQEKLLREPDPSLEKVIDIVRANEIAVQQAKEMQNKLAEVHLAYQKREQAKSQNKGSGTTSKEEKVQTGGYTKKCWYCMKPHEFRKELCPAFGRQCKTCGGKNHFSGSIKCSQKRSEEAKPEAEEAKHVTYAYLNSIKSKGHKKKTITVKVTRTGSSITFQIDTGASVNVMSLHDYMSATGDFSRKFLKPVNMVIISYGGKEIKAVGATEIEVSVKGKTHTIEVTVVNVKATPLLSLQTCEHLQIVKILNCDQEPVHVVKQVLGLSKEDVLKKYPDLFEGLGKLPGKLKIHVKDAAKPVIHAPRKVPVALKEDLKSILEQMERDGIITKVEEPTDWVSSMLVKKEPNKLRICLDPKDLNNAIRREHYPLPRIEEVATRLEGVKVFSVLDVKSGFWHIELEEGSSYLTTFNTPFGRYRWLRMPFGLNLAPEIWQRRMHQFIEDLRGIEVIADDFLVTGRGETLEEATQDHDRNLENFLIKARQQNLKLNGDKMKIKLDEVRFIGHILTPEGIKIDPRKVEAITNMPDPQNEDDLRRFLGMVQYLSKFLPKLSHVTEPLRKLTTGSEAWNWTSDHEKCFKIVKKLVCSTPVLAYFDSRKEVTIQADASQGGLGAVLMQEGKPVTLSSRTMTPTERNYAQIEKEMLAIVHACSKFDEYIYGQPEVNVETDHKPLESIFRKPMNSAPKRLQRMLLFLHNYNLKVKYKPGPQMYIADALSRAYLKDSKVEPLDVMQIREKEVVADCEKICTAELSNAGKALRDVAAATTVDPTLQEVIKLVKTGWPEKRSQVALGAKPYFDSRTELIEENGILYKLNRVVIPESMRKFYLSEIHSSHIGVENCLRRAREYVYWPNMNSQVKDFVSTCELCNSMRKEQQKESMLSYEIPDRAWKTVSADLFQCGSLHYLVVVDHYSSFVECDRVFSLEPECVVSLMMKQFSRYGIPDTVISDCGTQFTSKKFKDFAKDWGFDHITSSPRYPQSNGKAESAVKIVKSLLKKAIDGKGDFYKALLDWRNTPTAATGLSPSQRMFGRRTRTNIPTHPELLRQADGDFVKSRLLEAKEKQRIYYEKGIRDLSELSPGEAIRMKLPGCRKWEKGVVKAAKGHRSYVVEVKGTLYVRNRRQLLKPGDEMLTPQSEKVPSAEGSGGSNQKDHSEPVRRKSTRSRRSPGWYPQSDYDLT